MTSVVALSLRIILAGVLLAAALGKLRDRASFAQALTEFGVTSPALTRLGGVVIPVSELAVAGLLVSVVTARTGAAASLVLLVTFTVGVANVLKQGRATVCHCFGPADAAPVSRATLARNGLLILLAALILLGGPGSRVMDVARALADSSSGSRGFVALALWLPGILVALVWTTIGLSDRVRRLTARLDGVETQLDAQRSASVDSGTGLPPGSVAPPFDLPVMEGGRAALGTFTERGHPVVLVFLDVMCKACGQLWPDLERWQKENADAFTCAAICGGAPEMLEMKLMMLDVHNVLLQERREVLDAYELPGTPSAVVVGPDGHIARGGAVGVAPIRKLVSEVIAGQQPPR